jgi:hypothetical protein
MKKSLSAQKFFLGCLSRLCAVATSSSGGRGPTSDNPRALALKLGRDRVGVHGRAHGPSPHSIAPEVPVPGPPPRRAAAPSEGQRAAERGGHRHAVRTGRVAGAARLFCYGIISATRGEVGAAVALDERSDCTPGAYRPSCFHCPAGITLALAPGALVGASAPLLALIAWRPASSAAWAARPWRVLRRPPEAVPGRTQGSDRSARGSRRRAGRRSRPRG